MLQPIRQLAFDLISDSLNARKSEAKARTDAIPARLTDIYVERIPVTVLSMSRCGIGLKVDERFRTDLPVLIECDGLLIVGDVRHCMKVSRGGFVLGMKIQTIVDTVVPEGEADQTAANRQGLSPWTVARTKGAGGQLS
jgi:hypothetical protein